MATSGTSNPFYIYHVLTRNIDTTVDRVPVEVLQDIFLFMVAESDAFDITQMDDGPWVLCQVRRQWRAIASSLPGLWSRFTLWADATTIRESRRTHYLLDVAIPRSTIHPLDFSVVIADNNAAQVVLPHLIEAMDWWSNIHLEAPRQTFQFFAEYVRLTLDSVNGSPSEVMGHLESVELVSLPNGSAWNWDSQRIFEPALNLRSVYMEGVWARSMPWGRLTDTCIDGQVGRVDAVELLSVGSALRELEMTNEFIAQLQIGPPTVVVHHSLQILRISDPSILAFLRAPCLITLEFLDCIFWEPDKDKFGTISRFLVHSPILQKMSITVHWMDTDRIRTDLSFQLPRLRELEITIEVDNAIEDGNSVFVDFTQAALVELERFTIKGHVKFCAKELLEMLIYRKTAGSELHHVYLHCAQFIASEDEHQRLSDTMKHGLDLEIVGE
ncbi:hypothetical protein EDD85DRAFT_962386 [Armillaria nabsnona]|nr:hypothetical protein EDD85DRAFT_962386 [Armillaria nabsnona]